MIDINCLGQSAEPFPLAIIVSRFNEPVTSKLLAGALNKLKELSFPEHLINVIHVPGAVEIPLVAKYIAKQHKAKAIITLGAVIRGETGHYDYVCQQVSDGCLQVSLEYALPVIFGILTTENSEQAFARAGGTHSDKGAEAVISAIEMVSVLAKVNCLDKC